MQKRTFATIGYYAAFIVLGAVGAALGPTLPDLARQTGVTLKAIGVVFTARSLGYLLGSSQGGRLYDHLPGHPLVAMALFVLAAMVTLVPLSGALWLLIGAWFVLGLGEGTVDVGCNTLLLWTYKDRAGPFLSGLHFFFGLGSLLSPILIAQVILLTGGIRWGYWTLALVALPVAGWLLSAKAPEQRGDPRAESSDRRIRYVPVILISFFLFLYVGAEIGFSGWVFTYAVQMNLADEVSASYLVSVFWGALTAGRLLAVPISGLVKPRYLLFGALAGCLISLGIPLLWPTQPLSIWVASVGLGGSMAAIFPTTLALAERRLGATGKVMGWFFGGSGLGGMLLPGTLGQVIESFRPQAMIVAIGLDLLVAVGVLVTFLLIPVDRPRISETEEGEGQRSVRIGENL